MHYRYTYTLVETSGFGITLPGQVKLVLTTFKTLRETPKGFWIGSELDQIWVSRTSKRRYAYPTKKEALSSLGFRVNSRIKILTKQLDTTKEALRLIEEGKNDLEDEIFLDSLLGKSKDDAIALCLFKFYNYRIVKEDNIDFIITMDLHLKRVNLEIEGGLVSKSYFA